MLRILLMFLLGVLAPIDVLGDIPASALDVARYSIAFVLIILLLRESSPRSGVAVFVLVLLSLVNGIGLLRAGFQDSFGGGAATFVGLASVIVGFLVARHPAGNRSLLYGLLLGASLSATDIVFQLLGLPYLGTPTQWGIRYSGLSFSPTNTAPYLALGLVLVVSRYLWRPVLTQYLIRVLLLGLLTWALLASGGRGGVVGFFLALVVWGFFLFRSHPSMGIIVAITATCATVLFWDQLWSYINRSDSSTGISSGRDTLNAESWGAFIRGGVFGIDAVARDLYRPHTPILTFALDAGAAGLVVALILVSILIWRILRPANGGHAGQVLSMMATVLVVTSLLEPTGFFVGLGKVIVLMIVVSSNGLPPQTDYSDRLTPLEMASRGQRIIEPSRRW